MKFLRAVVLSATLTSSVLAFCGERVQDDYPKFTALAKVDFSKRLISSQEAKDLEKEDKGREATTGATYLRGIIFGRHGRIFVEKDIQDYLKESRWYRANPSFSNAMLSDTERRNLDIVRGIESGEHYSVKPGDLRFWMTKPLKPLSTDVAYSISDVRIMEAEIEAIHGRTFPNEPLLQKYFSERYWYKPNASYKFADLSAIEKKNLAALNAFDQKLRGSKFSPQDTILYANKVIPTKLLDALSLYELRLTRNAVYALHGHRFKTAWIQDYFANVEWYSPAPGGAAENLTASDTKNLANVLAIESRLHNDLSTKPVAHDRLTGLFVEDIRKLANEIPARHGMVFKESSLRNYFTSLPWYKPDPGFKVSRLSKIEKSNYDFLLDAAKKTTRQFAMEEG